MAAGAGALDLALGGAASYDGVAEVRPPLGEGDTANAADILRALRLVETGAALWCGVALLAAIFLSGVIHA